MIQVVFNKVSAAEMSQLPKMLQLDLLGELQFMEDDLKDLDPHKFGTLTREGKTLYRFRAHDYRIYFEKSDEGIRIHRVLHKNTIRDFLYRTKLPTAEDNQLEKAKEFWELIDEGRDSQQK
jgi:mRNA-degrading endonuclease RelE of RelBE toxin-antitoxin system